MAAKILLVEDNEMNRDMLSRRLQRRGYEVLTAVDGENGLALTKSETPALVRSRDAGAAVAGSLRRWRAPWKHRRPLVGAEAGTTSSRMLPAMEGTTC